MTKPCMTRVMAALMFRLVWSFCSAGFLVSPPALILARATSLDARPAVEYLAGQSKFVLDATGMATSSGPVTYAWTLTARPAGSLATLTGSNSPTAQLNADANGPFSVELVLTEGGVSRAPVAVQLTRDNVDPVSVIKTVGGAAPAALGLAVRLSGAGSYDPDGDRLSYLWSLVSKPAGSAAALNAPSALNSSFWPDVAGAYKVSLTVTDRAGLSATDTLEITTGKGLTIADAGPDQSVPSGASVFVDAFQSVQTKGEALTAQWRIVSAPASSSAALADGSSLNPRADGRQSLTPSAPGLYVLNARVSGGGESADTMVISAGPGANVAPRPCGRSKGRLRRRRAGA
jgi:PKD domain